MWDQISLEGPLALVDGRLAIIIPLEAGGAPLAPYARGIGVVEDACLKVVIQPWLAAQLRVGAGSLVVVDNLDGKFRITRSAANDGPAGPSGAV
jgi:hypothetical protein